MVKKPHLPQVFVFLQWKQFRLTPPLASCPRLFSFSGNNIALHLHKRFIENKMRKYVPYGLLTESVECFGTQMPRLCLSFFFVLSSYCITICVGSYSEDPRSPTQYTIYLGSNILVYLVSRITFILYLAFLIFPVRQSNWQPAWLTYTTNLYENHCSHI